MIKLFYSITITLLLLGCGSEPTDNQGSLDNSPSTVTIFSGQHIDSIKITRSTPIRVDRSGILFLEDADEEVKSIRIDGRKDYIKLDCNVSGIGLIN